MSGIYFANGSEQVTDYQRGRDAGLREAAGILKRVKQIVRDEPSIVGESTGPHEANKNLRRKILWKIDDEFVAELKGYAIDARIAAPPARVHDDVLLNAKCVLSMIRHNVVLPDDLARSAAQAEDECNKALSPAHVQPASSMWDEAIQIVMDDRLLELWQWEEKYHCNNVIEALEAAKARSTSVAPRDGDAERMKAAMIQKMKDLEIWPDVITELEKVVLP